MTPAYCRACLSVQPHGEGFTACPPESAGGQHVPARPCTRRSRRLRHAVALRGGAVTHGPRAAGCGGEVTWVRTSGPPSSRPAPGCPDPTRERFSRGRMEVRRSARPASGAVGPLGGAKARRQAPVPVRSRAGYPHDTSRTHSKPYHWPEPMRALS
eukprot:scaffold137_cov398-Prasinococcus_capsulatus_cf.AAC.41